MSYSFKAVHDLLIAGKQTTSSRLHLQKAANFIVDQVGDLEKGHYFLWEKKNVSNTDFDWSFVTILAIDMPYYRQIFQAQRSVAHRLDY